MLSTTILQQYFYLQHLCNQSECFSVHILKLFVKIPKEDRDKLFCNLYQYIKEWWEGYNLWTQTQQTQDNKEISTPPLDSRKVWFIQNTYMANSCYSQNFWNNCEKRRYQSSTLLLIGGGGLIAPVADFWSLLVLSWCILRFPSYSKFSKKPLSNRVKG